jgi:hypothetical protein
LRAEAQLRRDTAAAAGRVTTEIDELISELDDEINRAGIRGTVTTRHDNMGDRKRGRRPGPPGAARTPPRSPPERSRRAPPGRSTPRQTGNGIAPPCS